MLNPTFRLKPYYFTIVWGVLSVNHALCSKPCSFVLLSCCDFNVVVFFFNKMLWCFMMPWCLSTMLRCLIYCYIVHCRVILISSHAVMLCCCVIFLLRARLVYFARLGYFVPSLLFCEHKKYRYVKGRKIHIGWILLSGNMT